MDTIVLVCGCDGGGGGLDGGGSDERHQASEDEVNQLHRSFLTVVGLVLVVCDIDCMRALIVDGGGGR